jgi:hypothetical protein
MKVENLKFKRVHLYFNQEPELSFYVYFDKDAPPFCPKKRKRMKWKRCHLDKCQSYMMHDTKYIVYVYAKVYLCFNNR